jgi:hypothetical protein
MLRDFVLFLYALWDEWKVLLTGGSIFALVAAWSLTTSRPIPSAVNWLILGLTLILAAFLAWRKEWIHSGSGFVDVDPARLYNLLRTGSDLHVKAVLSPYIGKRIRVTGRLNNISESNVELAVQDRTSKYQTEIRVVLWEAIRWKRLVRLFVSLPLGTMITVTGRITAVLIVSGVWLSSCELVNVEPPPSIKPEAPSNPTQNP